MTNTQKQLVQGTFGQVAPIADTAAKLFYDRLFDLDPSLRALFKSDMDEQGRKLMQMIGAAVNGLDDMEALLPTVHDLGRRHANYGVLESHYETVGEALLWTLGQGLGEKFTPEVEEAWAETYTVLATVMKEAAA